MDYLFGPMVMNVNTTERIEVVGVDQINHPRHYTTGGVECIEAIKASMTPPEFEGYLKGNCLKYLWRYRNKDGVVSLQKCEWYLRRLIEELQGREALRALKDMAANQNEGVRQIETDDCNSQQP